MESRLVNPNLLIRPKEPNPLPKQGGLAPLGKSAGESLSVPLVLHKPPAKADGTATLSVAKPSATPKHGIESTATNEPVLKTESPVVDQPKAKGEAAVEADPPKAKAEAVSVEADPPKAKAWRL